MNKRDMRKEAIGRLQKALAGECRYGGVINAVLGDAFMYNSSRQDALSLIDLLTDDDRLTEDDYLELIKDAAGDYRAMRSTYNDLVIVCNFLREQMKNYRVALPMDANGEVIHVGDELCGYGHPDGGVYCKAIVNERTILAGTDSEEYYEWLMWDAEDCRHYHKPTVEDVLGEFAIACEDAGNAGPAVVALIYEYAPRLQLKEDE